MRILLIAAGASFSIKDVENGYRQAFKDLGHEVIFYALDGRLDMSTRFLHMVHEERKEDLPDLLPPTDADVMYHAGIGVLERAGRFMPDWVIITSGMYLHPDLMIMLRQFGFRTAIILTESPYDDEAQVKVSGYVDAVFTNERTSLRLLRTANQHSYYLPHAYDPVKHSANGHELDDEVDAHDVVFVGTGFIERVRLLEAVDWTGIDFGLYGYWPLLDEDSPLHAHLHDYVVDNAATAALYRQAKIGLNLYRSSIGFGEDVRHVEYAESMNPRAVELAASGCFTLSTYRAEVHEVFDEAVPTFDDATELESLIRYYLERPTVRKRWAKQLPTYVEGQTYHERAKTLLGVLGTIEIP